MRGFIVSGIGLFILMLAIFLEGASFSNFFHLLALLFIIPLGMGLYIAIRNYKDPDAAAKRLGFVINLNWVGTFLLLLIYFIRLYADIDLNDHASIGGAVSSAIIIGVWGAVTNFLLYPLYFHARIRCSDDGLDTHAAFSFAGGCFAIAFFGLACVFWILFLLSGGGESGEDVVLNIDTGITSLIKFSSGGTGLILWFLTWFLLKKKKVENKPRLWILSGGYAFGFCSFLVIIGCMHVLANLGNATTVQLLHGIYLSFAPSLAWGLFFAGISILIAFIQIRRKQFRAKKEAARLTGL